MCKWCRQDDHNLCSRDRRGKLHADCSCECGEELEEWLKEDSKNGD